MTTVKKGDGKILDMMLARPAAERATVTKTLDLMQALKTSLDTPAEPVVVTPGPGVYRGIPAATYHRWSGASNSRLSRLRQSPAHLQAYLAEPPEDTAALAIGRASHTAILEPDDFASKYGCAPASTDRRTKAGKEVWEELEAKFGPGHVFKQDEYVALVQMRDSVLRHAGASALLKELVDIEVSIVWIDPDSGVSCKARLDGHSPALPGGAIVDVKTTKDASEREFAKSIYTFGYHRQGRHYLNGAAATGLPARHFSIIAVEKEPPYAVAVYRVIESALDAGGDQLKPLLKRFGECVERNEWPAYPEVICDIGLPDYAWKQIETETLEAGR